MATIATVIGVLALSSPASAAVNATSVATGSANSCIITAFDHALYCDGYNGYGQAGHGGGGPAMRPVSGLTSGVKQVSIGYMHICVAMLDGTAKCLGYNALGALGDGTLEDNNQPQDVLGIEGSVKEVAAGRYGSCALTEDGHVWCWGQGILLGNGFASDSGVAGQVPGLENVKSIAAGSSHVCALLDDGTVKCWGSNYAGQLGNGGTANSLSPVAVTGLPAGATSIASSSSATHTCAAVQTGQGFCWGNNSNGQLGDGTTTTRRTPVEVTIGGGAIEIDAPFSVGTDSTCYYAKCWGGNSNGQLGNGTTTRILSAGSGFVAATSKTTQVAAGDRVTCAREIYGGVKCWGRNSSGELGNDTYVDSKTPVVVGGFQ